MTIAIQGLDNRAVTPRAAGACLFVADVSRLSGCQAALQIVQQVIGAWRAEIALLGRDHAEIVKSYDLAASRTPLGAETLDAMNAQEDGGVFEIEGTPDAERETRTLGAPLLDSYGALFGALLLTVDAHRPLSDTDAETVLNAAQAIADRIEVEGQLSRTLRSEARLADAIDAASDGFVLYDSDDRLIFCNQRYREIYQQSSAAMIVGATFEEVLREGLANGQYLEAIGREEEWFAERLRRHNDPGEPIVQRLPGDRWLQIEERRTSDGGLAGFRVDVTPLKRQQIELEKAKSELQQHRDELELRVAERTAVIEAQSKELEAALEQERRLNNLQRSFVSMASHEFRTPLAIIDGSVSRLRRRADRITPDDLSRYCEKISGSVKRMLTLIESTLAAARLDAGTLRIEPKPCDVAEVLRDCCDRQEEICGTHRIHLSVDAEPGPILADPSAVDQVFTNLLSNAVKYSNGADRVDVRLWREQDELLIAVQDFGLGMDAEDLDRMGERYFRGKTSTGIAGTGIGLNLVVALLELHGGALRVASTLGEGSIFTVRLPIRTVEKA